MLKNKVSAIIFDLDGTLVDSARDLTSGVNYVLKKAGRAEITHDQVRLMVGHGPKELIIKAFSHTGILPPPDDIDKLTQQYLDHCLENISEKSVLYDGASALLNDLHAQDIPLGICTNKMSILTHALLKALNIDHYFTAVTCCDSFDYKKPDPRHIISTCQMMGADHRDAIMIGDSSSDIKAANAANMQSIAVSFGYSNIAPSDLGASAVIDHFDQFMAVANKIIR